MAVPIIGQPRIGSWFYTVQIICSCGSPTLLVGQVGSRAACPNTDCGKVYSLNGLPTVNDTGDFSVPLGVAIGTALGRPS